MARPPECRNISHGEQQVFWTHVWQSHLRVGIEEMATNIRVSWALTEDMCDRLPCWTLQTRRTATATLSVESVHGSAASSSKTEQKPRARPLIPVHGRRVTGVPSAVRGPDEEPGRGW
ncbi:hypothetical protein MRX96_051066 [Rhipicephalus microplus]